MPLESESNATEAHLESMRFLADVLVPKPKAVDIDAGVKRRDTVTKFLATLTGQTLFFPFSLGRVNHMDRRTPDQMTDPDAN